MSQSTYNQNELPFINRVHTCRLTPAYAVSLKQLMQRDIVHFAYMKQDGTIRTAFGTLCQNIIDKVWKGYEKRKKRESDDIFIYFDIEKNEWRSFFTGRFMGIDKFYNTDIEIEAAPAWKSSGYYFYHTVREGSKEKLKPLPGQFDHMGNPIDVNMNVAVAMGDKKLREAYPIGTVFCSQQCLCSGGYYNAGMIYPILDKGGTSYKYNFRLPTQAMLTEYDNYKTHIQTGCQLENFML